MFFQCSNKLIFLNRPHFTLSNKADLSFLDDTTELEIYDFAIKVMLSLLGHKLKGRAGHLDRARWR